MPTDRMPLDRTSIDGVPMSGVPGVRVTISARLRRFDPSILLWIAIAAVLIFLVVNPLLRLAITSLQDADTGAFTLHNYVTAYARPRYRESLWNSLELGALVTSLCLVISVPLAWAVARTDMP